MGVMHGHNWLRAVLIGAIAVIGISSAALADPVTIRGTKGDGVGRLTFTWPAPVPFVARITGRQLVVQFTRPVESNFAGLPGALSDYISRPSLSGGGRVVTFPLKGEFDFNYNARGNVVTVNLIDLSPPANVSEKVGVRTGAHPQYGRVVFDWVKNVDYSVDRQGNRASINFKRRANVAVAPLNRRGLGNVAGADSVVTGDGTTVVLKIPSTSRLRHFRSGAKIVVDVFNPTGANDANGPPPASLKPPQVRQAAAAPALAQQTQQANTSAGPVTLAPVTAPAQAAASAAPAANTPSSPAPNPEPRTADASPPPAPAPQAQPPATGAGGGNGSVRLDFQDSVAAAVFRRAGILWLVFDRAQNFDTRQIMAQGAGTLLSANQFSAPRGTFLRLVTAPGVNPTVRRDGNAWIFDFKQQQLAPQTPIQVQSQPDSQTGPRLYIPIPQAGEALAFHDAEVGDNLVVVPITNFSHGINKKHEYPQLRILPTAQGVVFQPKVDDIRIRPSTQGVEVSSVSKMTISPSSPKLTANAKIATISSVKRIFKPVVWREARREGMTTFRSRRQELLDKVAAARGSAKQAARQDYAIYLIGQNFAYEAAGVVDRMYKDNTALEGTPQFRLLRGMTNVLMERYDDAHEDLKHDTLNGSDEGQLWRAINRASQGNLVEAAPTLKGTGTIIRSYPKRLKTPLGLLIADAGVAAGDLEFATDFLRVVSEEEPTPKEVDQLALLEGKLQKLAGNFDGAIEAWKAAAEGEHRPSIVNSIVLRADLLLQLDKIKPKDAIEELEKLRFSWRGGDFEFNLLRRLGRLYLDVGDYRNGLRTLRSAATYFRNNPAAPDVTQEMAGVFMDLYLNDAADKMPPVRAIALYDEFKELTPPGERGDEMIRKLADRLAQVDLLDRAAKLLRQQVDFRLKGELKARVGARLATVRLLNREPAMAADALKKSEAPGLPLELINERRLLMGRALVDQGRGPEAIVLLEDDESLQADRLKVEVYRKAKDWGNASQVFKRILATVGANPGEKLDDLQALYVLNMAVIQALGKKQRGTLKLREAFGQAMNVTRYKDAFNLISSPDSIGLTDYRQVAGTIETVSNFASFMAEYKKRMKEGNLSQLN
ncbi:MAG: tetratricopeptide repeat protein [Rhodospirillaceae bacterium]